MYNVLGCGLLLVYHRTGRRLEYMYRGGLEEEEEGVVYNAYYVVTYNSLLLFFFR
jgi:hypothetical protein